MRNQLAWGLAAILAGFGLGPVSALGRAGGRHPPPRAHILRVIDLPGYSGMIDPNGRMIYLVHNTSQTSAEIIAFDWRRRRVVWRAPDKGFLLPLGISPSALILAEYIEFGPLTSGPLAGLDRKTGRTLWKQPSSAEHEGNNGVDLVGGRILKALPGKVVCMSAASGREIWSRDFGIQTGSHNWPYPPAEAAGTAVTQLVTDQTRVVVLDSRNGQTRWSHAFPWTVYFFEAGSDVRYVGPQAAAGSSVVALVPSGAQPQSPGETYFPLPPPSTLYCWDARTGRLRWRQSAPWTNDPPLVGPRAIVLLRYSLKYGMEVCAIGYSLATWRPLWHREGHFLEVPDPPGQHPYGAVLQRSEKASNELLSVDPESGRVRWRCRLPLSVYIPVPLVTYRPGRILAVDEGHLGIAHWNSWLLVLSVPRRPQRGDRARRRTGSWRRPAAVPRLRRVFWRPLDEPAQPAASPQRVGYLRRHRRCGCRRRPLRVSEGDHTMRAVLGLTAGLTLALGLCHPLPALAQGSFSDVPTDNWSLHDSVQASAAEGILKGYPDGTFGGRRAMTRWEFALALDRAVEQIEQELTKIRPPLSSGVPPAPTAGPFADVPTNGSRGDLLHGLSIRGIIRGYPDATFAGSRPITHDQAATALLRTLQWVDRELAAIRSAPTATPLR